MRHRALVDAILLRLVSDPSGRHSLAQLGRELGISPFQVARLFREQTGSSVRQYLIRLRLAVALERLAEGERNLSALAADLGFASHSHFTTTFRRVIGETPGRLRERLTARSSRGI
jgi:AraC family transcriptional regulator